MPATRAQKPQKKQEGEAAALPPELEEGFKRGFVTDEMLKNVDFDEDDMSYDYHEKDIVIIIDTMMGDMKERMSAINAQASSILTSSENMIRSQKQIATLLAAHEESDAVTRARARITEGLASAQNLVQNYEPNFDNIEEHFTKLSDLTAKICSPMAHKESKI